MFVWFCFAWFWYANYICAFDLKTCSLYNWLIVWITDFLLVAMSPLRNYMIYRLYRTFNFGS